VVKLLLEKGAELETNEENYGLTPLLCAAIKGHEAVVKLLLKKGASNPLGLGSKSKRIDLSIWTARSNAFCHLDRIGSEARSISNQ